ncbi:MAG: hypothetical protein ACOY99_12455 [Pseudomonadota bacterium]
MNKAPLAATGILALALAACAAPTPPPSPPPEPGPAAVPPDAALAPPVPPALPDPEKLKNRTPAEIAALLGSPGLIRWEGDAQVYQYIGRACVLDLVFYEQGAGAAFRLVYFEARDGASALALDAAPCLDGLIKAQAEKR